MGDLKRACESATGHDADEQAFLGGSSLEQRIASGPGMVTTWSISAILTASPASLGMKSGVQPRIGWGLNKGLGRSDSAHRKATPKITRN
jgi:hypothetical protein